MADATEKAPEISVDLAEGQPRHREAAVDAHEAFADA
jgi:hypothetical protein